MAVCSRDPSHVYPGHNKTCPWCAAAATAAPAPKQIPLPAVRAPKPTPTPAAPRPTPASRPTPTAAITPTVIPKTPSKPGTGTNGRGFVTFVLVSLLATSVTVLVPWLIGANALRDSAFRPASGLVYSISNRDGGAYFLTDYLAGLVVTTAIAGALLVLAALLRIRHRIGRLLLGVGLVALSFAVLTPVSATAWVGAEQATARAEASTAAWHADTCSTDQPNEPTISLESAGVVHVWSVAPVDDDGDGACTQVEIWDGLRLIRTVETPDLRDGFLSLVAGTSAEDSYVQFIGRGPVPDCGSSECQPEYEIAGGFSLVAAEVMWQYTSRFTAVSAVHGTVRGPAAIAIPGVGMVALENPETAAGTATAFDPATGAALWRAQCPADFPIESNLYVGDYGDHVLFCNSERPFSGPNLDLLLGDDGSLSART